VHVDTLKKGIKKNNNKAELDWRTTQMRFKPIQLCATTLFNALQ